MEDDEQPITDTGERNEDIYASRRKNRSRILDTTASISSMSSASGSYSHSSDISENNRKQTPSRKNKKEYSDELEKSRSDRDESGYSSEEYQSGKNKERSFDEYEDDEPLALDARFENISPIKDDSSESYRLDRKNNVDASSSLSSLSSSELSESSSSIEDEEIVESGSRDDPFSPIYNDVERSALDYIHESEDSGDYNIETKDTSNMKNDNHKTNKNSRSSVPTTPTARAALISESDKMTEEELRICLKDVSGDWWGSDDSDVNNSKKLNPAKDSFLEHELQNNQDFDLTRESKTNKAFIMMLKSSKTKDVQPTNRPTKNRRASQSNEFENDRYSDISQTSSRKSPIPQKLQTPPRASPKRIHFNTATQSLTPRTPPSPQLLSHFTPSPILKNSTRQAAPLLPQLRQAPPTPPRIRSVSRSPSNSRSKRFTQQLKEQPQTHSYRGSITSLHNSQVINPVYTGGRQMNLNIETGVPDKQYRHKSSPKKKKKHHHVSVHRNTRSESFDSYSSYDDDDDDSASFSKRSKRKNTSVHRAIEVLIALMLLLLIFLIYYVVSKRREDGLQKAIAVTLVNGTVPPTTLPPTTLPPTLLSASPSSSIFLDNGVPSSFPTFSPSNTPTVTQSQNPSTFPSTYPSLNPTITPSSFPSDLPTTFNSHRPSRVASDLPSIYPSSLPSEIPSAPPSLQPSSKPSNFPSKRPSPLPSKTPTKHPTKNPTKHPTRRPTSSPTTQSPTNFPSFYPSFRPSQIRSNSPSSSVKPTPSPTLPPTFSFQWNPIVKFESGSLGITTYSVSLSGSGNTLAILHGNGITIWKQEDSSNKSLWKIQGTNLEPDIVLDRTEISNWDEIYDSDALISSQVVLSLDGTQVFWDASFGSEGRSGIFYYYEGVWRRRGVPGKYETSPGGKFFGDSVGFARLEKNRILVTAWNNFEARVYTNDNLQWYKVGQSIVGYQPSNWDKINGYKNNPWFGASSAISADGNTIAIASPSFDTNGNPNENKGKVDVYGLTAQGSWVKKGQSLFGSRSGQFFGIVALSGNGNRLVIGSPIPADRNGSGSVKILDYLPNNKRWELRGTLFAPRSNARDNFGQVFSLSENGNVVAIGAPLAGYVCVYQYIGGGLWAQMDECIQSGVFGNDSTTYSLSLSSNGSRIVVGTHNKNVIVYEYGRPV